MPNQFVAFQDERHGLGAWVAEDVAEMMFGGTTPPAGGARKGFSKLNTPGGATRESIANTRNWTSPRVSAEATLSAVVANKAHLGVLPLYDHDGGFRRDTLAALIDFPMNEVVFERTAESKFVLAAPAALIHEIEQASHSNSFGAGSARDFEWNQDKQRKYLNRVETIYASAEAMNQCEAALDGYRARGIDVQQIPDGVDSFREGLKIAHAMLDPGRVVETRYSAQSHERVSRMRGANQSKPVVAVLLAFDKVVDPVTYDYNQDYVLLDTEIAGADGIHTSFVVFRKNAPSIPPERANKAQWERDTLRPRYSLSLASDGADHRALYDTAKQAVTPIKGNFLRCIYKVNSVGPKAGDVGTALNLLRGASYMTTTLDNRPGHPMTIVVDIPKGHLKSFMPAIRRLTRMDGYRRLAAYPVDKPLIKDAVLPAPTLSNRLSSALPWVAAIVAAAAVGIAVSG